MHNSRTLCGISAPFCAVVGAEKITKLTPITTFLIGLRKKREIEPSLSLDESDI